MSKADDALTTSAKPTPTRRSILSGGVRIAGAAIAGMAAIPSVHWGFVRSVDVLVAGMSRILDGEEGTDFVWWRWVPSQSWAGQKTAHLCA
jgi:hypothetical protein